MSNKLDSLIEKYGERDTIKDRKIELKLKYIKELYGECGKSEEMHLFSEIVDNFCEILESVQPVDTAKVDAIPWAPYEFSFTDEFGSDEEFFEVFRIYFSDRHAESTITDYINRIKTFRNNNGMYVFKPVLYKTKPFNHKASCFPAVAFFSLKFLNMLNKIV